MHFFKKCKGARQRISDYCVNIEELPLSLDIYFSNNPLDRADHLRGDDAWIATQMTAENSRFLLLQDLKPLMHVTPALSPHWVDYDKARPFIDAGADFVFLGLNNNSAHFAVHIDGEASFEMDGKWIDLRSIGMSVENDAYLGILAQARSLLAWRERRRFCSVCGHPNRMEKAGYVIRCGNDACAAEHFPRTDPVVIMLAVHEDKCLLGRSIQFPPGRFSALAGFVEPGETIEEAVRREVREETSVEVGDVHYIASQPWPFPSSLMIGCLADAHTTEITLDTKEIADAFWASRDEVRSILKGDEGRFLPPPAMAIARQLLNYWISR